MIIFENPKRSEIFNQARIKGIKFLRLLSLDETSVIQNGVSINLLGIYDHFYVLYGEQYYSVDLPIVEEFIGINLFVTEYYIDDEDFALEALW